MAKVYIKPYKACTITGSDFQSTMGSTLIRIVFSPDNVHSVPMVSLTDGTLLLSNEARAAFSFTVSRKRRVLAVVTPEFNHNSPLLKINTNWIISEDGVKNRMIRENPNLFMSPKLNIDMEGNGIVRFDMKIENSDFAFCILSEKDLLFIRMNGNHFLPKLQALLNDEIERSVFAALSTAETARARQEQAALAVQAAKAARAEQAAQAALAVQVAKAASAEQAAKAAQEELAARIARESEEAANAKPVQPMTMSKVLEFLAEQDGVRKQLCGILFSEWANTHEWGLN